MMPFSFLSNGSNIKVPKEMAKKTKGKQQAGGNITIVKTTPKKRQNQDRDKIYKEKRKLT
jgi:hypothetical protein